MKRFALTILLASIAAWPSLAQPLATAPDPRFDCLLEGISAEQRQMAASGDRAELVDAAADEAALNRAIAAGAEAEARRSAAVEAIAANARRCGAAAGWTDNQRELALQYVLMQLTREDMIRRYAAQNVDLTFIDTALATARPDQPLPLDALAARLRAQGIADERPDSPADIVYIYLMIAAQSAEIRRRFDDPTFRPQ